MPNPCVVPLCTLLLPLAIGCTSPLAGGQKVLKFHAHDAEALADAPSTGTYVVAYRQVGTKELWSEPGTRRKVEKGEPLGFARDETGRVVAVAGSHEKVIGEIPVVAVYACWYRVSDRYQADRKALAGLRDAAGAIAKVAVIGSVIALDVWVQSLADDAAEQEDAAANWYESPTWQRYREPSRR